MNKKGFTLIELIIVISIILLLASIFIPVFKAQSLKAKQRAADKKTKVVKVEKEEKEVVQKIVNEANKVIDENRNDENRTVIKKIVIGGELSFDELEIYRNNTSQIDSEVKIYKKLQEKLDPEIF